uniref:Uncharacterized protein n=1 Tax=viral metagenome TaxID=1070528 RepID=A0A6C0LY22_9ZZZZ
MTSVLEKEYIEPNRPYSRNELNFKRDKLYTNLRLGKHTAYHDNCRHHYRVRTNGRKEKELLAMKNNDVGNCSVCWTLSKTPSFLKDRANELVEHYTETFQEDQELLEHDTLDLETTFYKWLYLDNEKNNRR